ncbi:hypothetical protein [Piscinibacterium candidicorallinum]|uniref:Uncharacterized protein n=1 Tax=Piscinibacterium candidicorallinum TaxID=1793872 RepID=A0ABV7H8E0_9BURK
MNRTNLAADTSIVQELPVVTPGALDSSLQTSAVTQIAEAHLLLVGGGTGTLILS